MLKITLPSLVNHIQSTYLNTSVICYLVFYFLLLLVASLHKYLLVIINAYILIYTLVLHNNNTNYLKASKNLNAFLFACVIGNYVIFQSMVYFYIEILPWELIVLIIFYVFFLYFIYYFKTKYDSSNSSSSFGFYPAKNPFSCKL